MSKQLLDTLENKVFSVVDTIETLRSEINGLKEERKTLEDKLQELILKMGNLENGNGHQPMEAASPESAMGAISPESVPEQSEDSPFGPAIQSYKDQSSEY